MESRIQNLQVTAPTVLQLPSTNTRGIGDSVTNTTKLQSETLTLTNDGTIDGSLTVKKSITIGTSTIFIDGGNNKLGIGDSSPETNFEVVGTASVSGATTFGSTVTVSGATTFSSTGNALLVSAGRAEFQGTASASYFLTGNTLQVGGFASAAYSRFGTATTGHANYISASNDLLVSGDLEVDGSISAQFASSSQLFTMNNTASASHFFKTNGSGGTNQSQFSIGVGNGTERLDIFNNDNSPFVTIASSGNVGIGTTSPVGLLHIAGSTTNTYIQRASADSSPPTLTFRKSRGTVASPTDIVDGDTSTEIIAEQNSGGTWFGGSVIDFNVDGTFTSGQRPPSRISFWTNAANSAQTERVRINASGNVGIGTTGPSQVLHVAGGARITTSVAVTDDRTLCTIAASGEIEFVNGACGISSRRYKENIRDLDYGLEELTKLNPVFFNYIKDSVVSSDLSLIDDRTKRRIGFIAEEVNEVIPEVVIWQNGQVESLDYAYLTALLVKGLQEVDAKVASLSGQFHITDSSDMAGFSENREMKDARSRDTDISSFFFSILNQFKQIGVIFEDGFVKAKEFIAEKITAKLIRADSFEIKDSATGELYCVRITNGEWDKAKGECNAIIPQSTPEPTPSPSPTPEAIPGPNPEPTPTPEASLEPSPTPSPEPTVLEVGESSNDETESADFTTGQSPEITPEPSTPEPSSASEPNPEVSPNL